MYFQKLKNNPDFQKTSSGLYYSVVAEAQGNSPLETDTVKVNHRILLVDGTPVADTYKSEPEIFPLSEALEGYREGLMMMAEGARYKFVLPPELAWGRRGAGSKIGPDAALIIDVRLEEIR